MTVLEKRSWDERVFELDCSRLVPAGVSISAVVAMVAEPATVPALEFGDPALNPQPVVYEDPSAPSGAHTAPAATVVQVLIRGGLAPPPVDGLYEGQMYLVRARLQLSNGDKVEATAPLLVKDSP